MRATSTAGEDPGLQVGERFPHALAAPDQHGEPQTLTSVIGEKGVALFFVRSADWCPFCRGQLADGNEHLGRFAELGVNVVSVSVDEVEDIAKFTSEADIRYTMLADPTGAINKSLGFATSSTRSVARPSACRDRRSMSSTAKE